MTGPPVSAWNLANALTGLRLLLVPLFAVLLLHRPDAGGGWRTAAFVAFVVACLTDQLDGMVARRHGWVTDVGKIADPVADKALVGTALIGLSVLGELPWWVTAVVLAREVGVTVLRLLIIRHVVMAASRGGKVKTLLQAVAVGLYVLPLTGAAQDVAAATMTLAFAVTLVTGVDYARRAVQLRGAGVRRSPSQVGPG
jgi:CDP-diacylglycerol---glycerol-3-phosphate 3-phosphatidyltransferase